MNQNGFSEAEVAAQLGLSEADVARLRKEALFEREEWTRKGRMVQILQSGVDKIKALLTAATTPEGITPPSVNQDKPQAPQRAEAEASSAEPHAFVKITELARNPTLLFGNLGDKPVRVRVRSNKNFLVGMEIPVRVDITGLCWYTGRCPRWKGRL